MNTTTRKQVMWLGVVAVLLVAPCAFAQEEVVTETPAAVPAEVVTETPAAVPAESPEDNVEVTDQAVAEQLPAAKKPSDKKHVIIMMYSMSLPLGDSWDYVGQYGWRGTSFEYRYRILPQFSVGATFGWNMSDDKEKGTWTQENVTITGTQVRRLDTLTLAATAHAWLTKSDVILPYLGLELGGYWVSRFTNMGWWSLEEEGWHFGIGPELGFLVPANRKVQFAFSVKYKYLVKTSDLPEEMFLTFNFGVGFLI